MMAMTTSSSIRVKACLSTDGRFMTVSRRAIRQHYESVM
jgi:hypothetical protein